MKDKPRLIISNKRIENLENDKLELSSEEKHYLNKVMRVKTGDEIFIVNGKGYLWKGIKKEVNFIKIIDFNNPILFKDKETLLLGIAISLPKSGFEDILKMCTEIGIDIIQPLYSEHQVKKISNNKVKMNRWDSIINESVEQCERLWKPELLNTLNVYEWISNRIKNEIISISVTRDNNSISLNTWLKKQTFSINEKTILWNVIGPEGGWSKKELIFFKEKKIQFIKLSESILRTSTAAINATSILTQWRNSKMCTFNNL